MYKCGRSHGTCPRNMMIVLMIMLVTKVPSAKCESLHGWLFHNFRKIVLIYQGKIKMHEFRFDTEKSTGHDCGCQMFG